MASPDVGVAQVAYRNHPEITMSDHQPVSADFHISVRTRGVRQGGPAYLLKEVASSRFRSGL